MVCIMLLTVTKGGGGGGGGHRHPRPPPGYAPVKCNRGSINVLFSFYLASKGSKKRFNTDEHNASNAG